MFNFLKGRKTYIIATLMVLIGLTNFLSGDISFQQLLASPDLEVILQGLGLSALRAGVSKV